ncbi:MAG TPA: cobyrinic acid a,c-diamide synthase, partial [Isosphaeraceae bacterium]|nr:cobyrinic acid a,c-diamide synthase [Isosphaeraceae bacterium]
TEAVGQVTGLPGRHLDAWLMPPSVCRGLFARAAVAAELSVVEGTLEEPNEGLSYTSCDHPGDLRPVAEALDLPLVAVVSCRGLDTETVHLPHLPQGVDAVLLDELSDPESGPRLRRLVELASGLPVLGAIEDLPEVRAALGQLPRDRHLPEDLIEALARSFLKQADGMAIRELARRRRFPPTDELAGFAGPGRRRFRVAYAQDEAFGRYFPDTLEALEALGAELVEFSPLRDEALPAGVGLVMIGCGFPDHYADELAANLSMMAALGEHVCRGRRIYSEGGGTAYLGRRMIIAGRSYRGACILPFDAELRADPPPPAPVSRRLLHDSWLGPRGTVVRGYQSPRWRLIPGIDIESFGCPTCLGALSAEGDWFYHHHAVGSLLHLHFGALPEVVAAFAGPHRPSLRRPTARGLAERQVDHAAGRDPELEAHDPLAGPDL